jgi:hypothetical protein
MRREPLVDVLDFAATRNPAQRYQFLSKVMTPVRSGQVTLYGELGSSTSLGPIPVEYFNSHKPTWLNGIGVRTLDPKKLPSNQDGCYFGIYAPTSLQRMLSSDIATVANSLDGKTPVPAKAVNYAPAMSG